MGPVVEIPGAGRGGCAGQRVAARVVGLFAADAERWPAAASCMAPVSLVNAIIDLDFVRGPAVRGASDDVIEI